MAALLAVLLAALLAALLAHFLAYVLAACFGVNFMGTTPNIIINPTCAFDPKALKSKN